MQASQLSMLEWAPASGQPAQWKPAAWLGGRHHCHAADTCAVMQTDPSTLTTEAQAQQSQLTCFGDPAARSCSECHACSAGDPLEQLLLQAAATAEWDHNSQMGQSGPGEPASTARGHQSHHPVPVSHPFSSPSLSLSAQAFTSAPLGYQAERQAAHAHARPCPKLSASLGSTLHASTTEMLTQVCSLPQHSLRDLLAEFVPEAEQFPQAHWQAKAAGAQPVGSRKQSEVWQSLHADGEAKPTAAVWKGKGVSVRSKWEPSAADQRGRHQKGEGGQQAGGLGRKVDEASVQLELLRQEYEKHKAEKQHLLNMLSGLEACLQQQPHCQRVLQLVSRPPRPPCRIPASCSLVSFEQVPDVHQWTDAWLDRVRDLRAQDLLVLRRQLLQACSLLLTRAEQGGTGCPEARQLDAHRSRWLGLVQVVLALAPEAWLEIGAYDNDTLMPIQGFDTQWVLNVVKQALTPQAFQAVTAIAKRHKAKSEQLAAELSALMARYQQLAAAMGLPVYSSAPNLKGQTHGQRISAAAEVGASSAGGACQGQVQGLIRAGFRRESVFNWAGHDHSAARRYDLPLSQGADIIAELDALAHKIKVNTGQQLLGVQQLMCLVLNASPAVNMVKTALAVYPLVFSPVDFCSVA